MVEEPRVGPEYVAVIIIFLLFFSSALEVTWNQ